MDEEGRQLKKIAGIFLLLLPLGLASCNGGETARLEPIQVTEYEGEKLSSLDDFRENSINGPQYIDITDYRLEVSGLVASPQKYTYDEALSSASHFQKVVTLNCVEGWSVTVLWEGMLIRDLVEKSGPLPDACTVIFHAYDGYTTSFPLEYIRDNDILMAFKMNDIVIPPERGFPFQLVAESKWGYKWIKWITRIELSDDVDYRGYWESYGYSNSGDLNRDIFEDEAKN